ncbi:HEAT repeat domain-containing protein [Microlunatus sp. Y2014]|uniref:HEAT repeat domain-containing protein n=1 Tax=Microlunatus sp. Y2014 TaxID=3418488 RepID=UPI003DA76AA6
MAAATTAGVAIPPSPAAARAQWEAPAAVEPRHPVHMFCGAGDHLWVPAKEPVDSVATIDAMFEWMRETYRAPRMYWRALHPWAHWMEVGRGNVTSLQSWDWLTNWVGPLEREVGLDAAAIEAAHSRSMEIFYYTGMFEYGLQPDVGMIAPYQFEDRTRIDHPDWVPKDRWGQRRAPGPIALSNREARQFLVHRLADHLVASGYDGVNFYTYVENLGLRYLEEFGFEDAIVDLFAETYPDVDLRTAALTDEQRMHWARCRGHFVTEFLAELRSALATTGVRVSMILDSVDPDHAQPWWGKPLPGQGMVHLDWQRWIADGLVDEIWVQLGATADQVALLDRLIVACEGTPIKLTVRTPAPFDPVWDRFVAAGVTPVAVITSPRNGIEKVTLELTSASTWQDPDWKLRVQTLVDVAAGRLTEVAAGDVATLAADPHVLVRRMVPSALAKLGAVEHVGTVESLLFDDESSVRVAAATALATLSGPDTAKEILASLEDRSLFQLKTEAVIAWRNLGESAMPVLLRGVASADAGIREACFRALGSLGRADLLRRALTTKRRGNVGDDAWARSWALHRLALLRSAMSTDEQHELIDFLLDVVEGDAEAADTQIHVVDDLGHFSTLARPDQKVRGRAVLSQLFAEFGDGCDRVDAASGWRVVGNTLLAWHGLEVVLKPMIQQSHDRWLAWNAYEVVFLRQERTNTFNLVELEQAIADHDQYAPPFPGYRPW